MIDSIAAMLPRHDLYRAIEDKTMGTLAALMSQGLRKIVAQQGECSTFWINQIREKLGVMFGNPTTSPGGKAMNFYASATLEFTKGQNEKRGVPKINPGNGEWEDSVEIVAHEMRIKSIKDKTGSKPFSVCTPWYKYKHHPEGMGVLEWDEIWTLAMKYGIIQKDARTYSSELLDFRFGTGGWDESRAIVRDNPGAQELIKTHVLDVFTDHQKISNINQEEILNTEGTPEGEPDLENLDADPEIEAQVEAKEEEVPT